MGAATPPVTRRKRAMSAVPSESPRASADPTEHTTEHSGPESQAGNTGTDFGPNEWLVDELYQRYLADPSSVAMEWWNFFADYRPPPGSPAQPAAAPRAAGPAPAPAAPGTGRACRTGRTGERRTWRAAAPGNAAPAQAPARAPAPPAAPAGTAAAPARPAQPAPDGKPAGEPASAAPRARQHRGAAARRRRAHGRQHGGQPRRPHGDQRPGHPGQAAGRQPDRDQQPPGPRPGREGLVHPPHRLRRGAGAAHDAGDEPFLHHGRRKAGRGHAGTRQPGPGHRRGGARRVPAVARAQHQGGGGHGLPPVLDGLRGHRPPGQDRQADH